MSVETAPRPPEEFEATLGHSFANRDLLDLALTHKSYANEQAGGPRTSGSAFGDNERLEFLGDAVLDLALSEQLMSRFPQDPEGGLSKKRASLVNEETLSRLALELGLDQRLRLGKGETKTGGLQKPRILASTLEAVMGAIFLDAGYAKASTVVATLFALRIDEIGRSDVDFRHDFKTRLQEKIQELHKSTPSYKVEAELGPDHDKKFEVTVRLNEEILGTGIGKSKKAAEQDAARQALESLQ